MRPYLVTELHDFVLREGVASVEALAPRVQRLNRQIKRRAHRVARFIFHTWILFLCFCFLLGQPFASMHTATCSKRASWLQEGRKEGRTRGREKGSRSCQYVSEEGRTQKREGRRFLSTHSTMLEAPFFQIDGGGRVERRTFLYQRDELPLYGPASLSFQTKCFFREGIAMSKEWRGPRQARLFVSARILVHSC